MKEKFTVKTDEEISNKERWGYLCETTETWSSYDFQGDDLDNVSSRSTEPIIPSDSDNAFVRYLSQFVACFSIMMILFGKGISTSYSTIVVGSLSLENTTDYNRSYVDRYHNTTFFYYFEFNKPDQQSTYASISHICQPIGAIVGGYIIDIIGRKRVMILLNFPMFMGWILLFTSQNADYLFASNALFGIGIGLAESPIATYVAEVTQAEVRGVILTLALLFKTAAYLVPFIIVISIESWRWTAAFLSVTPVFVVFLASVVPESPSWLISKGRTDEAVESLRKLRGWVSKNQVQEEVDKLISYHENEKNITKVATNAKTKADKIKEEISYMVSYRIRKPFMIIITMFMISYSVGMLTIKPYLEIIISEMGVYQMDMKRAAMFVILCGGIGNLVGVLLVHYIGKRKLSLSGLAGNAVSCLVLALISSNMISAKYALYGLFSMSFSTWLGIAPLPWILQAELFPYTGRGKASGAAAAVNNLIAFTVIKTFILLKNTVELQGIFFLFFTTSILAAMFVYFKLPETEGKTKEQIEMYFKPAVSVNTQVI